MSGRAIARALVSVSDKSGLEPLARCLVELGVEVISTGGTARALAALGAAVREVSDFTGFPEIMDGRVKTLHPKIHGGLLGIRDNEAHLEAMREHEILPIDLVVVNLYPFVATVTRKGVESAEAIENIDIGGPSMIRSAAKNFRDVAVLVDPADYQVVIEELRDSDGCLSLETRLRLARKAFEHTAAYDAAIADFLVDRVSCADEVLQVHDPAAVPVRVRLDLRRATTLRYGENPHQQAALYLEQGTGHGGVAGAEQLQGKELSYNNYLDLDAAWALVGEFTDEAACVIIKHTNPCGAATAGSVLDAYQRALETDPTSAFGSIIACNRAIDGATATAMSELFVEAIAAPDFEAPALAVLGRKRNLRLMRMGADALPDRHAPLLETKCISGGVLVQQRDRGAISTAALQVVTDRPPAEEELRALMFAWRIVKHVKSNAVVYARDGQLVGVGAGQMSRVDSVRIGARKAVLPLAETVLASDAFFPFRDGLDEAARAGVTAVIQPGGSVRDQEVIAAANEHGIAMVFTGMRHFRH
jgi:phosphoribosylaminoimidazolecarboxamide formyltransferase/IMP cyclohydrolase